MKNNFIFSLAILTFVFVISSCNKYEAGPGLTIFTKKHRITGEWRIFNYENFNYELENEGIQKMEIFKDGLITYLEDSIEFTANWEFIKDKTSVSITNDYLNPTSYQEFLIYKLENKKMILEDKDGIRHTFKKS